MLLDKCYTKSVISGPETHGSYLRDRTTMPVIVTSVSYLFIQHQSIQVTWRAEHLVKRTSDQYFPPQLDLVSYSFPPLITEEIKTTKCEDLLLLCSMRSEV